MTSCISYPVFPQSMVVHKTVRYDWKLFRSTISSRYPTDTLMAEIFAGLRASHFREFRECGKLAKIKSRKRTLEYCLEPVTWDQCYCYSALYKERERTRELAGNAPNQGSFTPTGNMSFLLCGSRPVGGKHLVAAAASNTLINVVSICECNSETRTYETLLASFPNEQQRTELEHTGR